jgi:hypothetical protein
MTIVKDFFVAGIVLVMGCAAWAESEAPQTQPATTDIDETVLLKSLGNAYEPCVETVRGGHIDWTRGRVISQGSGKIAGSSGKARAMAERAARLAAARNALLTLGGVRVDESGRFALMEQGSLSVQGVLRDFEQTSVTEDPQSGTITVTLEAPLYGANGVLKQKITSESLPVVERKIILIDARGVTFRPVAFPMIRMEDGWLCQRGRGVMYIQTVDETDSPAEPPESPATQPALDVTTFCAKLDAKTPGILTLLEPDEEDALDWAEYKVVVLLDPENLILKAPDKKH